LEGGNSGVFADVSWVDGGSFDMDDQFCKAGEVGAVCIPTASLIYSILIFHVSYLLAQAMVSNIWWYRAEIAVVRTMA